MTWSFLSTWVAFELDWHNIQYDQLVHRSHAVRKLLKLWCVVARMSSLYSVETSSRSFCTTVRGCIKGTARCLSSIDHEAIVQLPIRTVILHFAIEGKLQAKLHTTLSHIHSVLMQIDNSCMCRVSFRGEREGAFAPPLEAGCPPPWEYRPYIHTIHM